MADFVVCLAYAPRPSSARGPWVALVEKNGPEWQAGMLNGPAGEVTGLLGISAATHFEAETGLTTVDANWTLLASLTDGTDTLHVMRYEMAAAFDMTGTGPEPANWYANDNLPAATVPYMRWLVPLGRDTNLTVAEGIGYTFEGEP